MTERRKKMQRGAAAVVLAGLLLTGCNAPGGAAGSGAQSAKPSTSAQGGKIYNDSMIGEAIAEEMTYKIDGMEDTYSFHVPRIISDLPAAQEINREIMDCFGAIYEQTCSDIEMQGYPEYRSVSWERNWNGSALSLIVCAQTVYETAEYYTWNIDMEKGARLTFDNLLNRVGMSTEEFLRIARREALRSFDATWRGDPEEPFDSQLAIMQREWTVSDENINGKLPVYLDACNALCAIVPVGVPAGSGVYQKPITLLTEPCKEMSAAEDWISASVKDNQLTVRFERTAAAEAALKGCNVTWNQPIPVAGAYKPYREMCIRTVGKERRPILFLVAENGCVEFVDLRECLSAGYFCVTAPLPSFTGVQSIKNGEAVCEDGTKEETVMAVNEKGEKSDLLRGVRVIQNSLPIDLQMDSWYLNSKQAEYFLELHEDGSLIRTVITEADGAKDFSGSWKYLGMTGEGIVLSYRMEDGASGALVCNVSDWDRLRLSQPSGAPMFGALNNVPVEMVRSYG